ncbi:MAG: beta-ketoacyl-ACP synthase [Aphanocapsa sp. GSE-SYN-MK-11-07L]|jgi:3-oxoacyl-[acyl-carrier-protein] synthase II|nr:beta-ketoacyl-ACP synthase [Aphanocapsa sp. GSE-SYN-MK-11-07L]
MAVPVVVTGIGMVSALGADPLTTWQRLLQGKTGIRRHQPFPELPPRPLGLIGDRPSRLAALTQQVVQATLADAGIDRPLPDCGVVIGSSRGCQAEWEDLARDRKDSAPLDGWLGYLPHAAAIAAARSLGTTGPVLAPMAACATGLWAIAQGFELLQTGQCQQVLVGAIEAPVTRLTLAGFAKMGALATTGAYPFDQQRQGLVVGEGGALFLLETLGSAQRRSTNIYGQILGFGASADAEHVSAPGQSQRGAIAALKTCLTRSHRQPAQIGYIHAHGTATQLNDQAEAALIHTCFPDSVPVSSTKGATGHTLGGSGALGAAFCLLALKHQILPPCVGLQQPGFAIDLITAARSVAFQTALCFSFGFGGQNAVLSLGRWSDADSAMPTNPN